MGEIFKYGQAACPKCANGIVVRYHLQDLTGADRHRVDRIWECAGNHRDTRVDER